MCLFINEAFPRFDFCTYRDERRQAKIPTFILTSQDGLSRLPPLTHQKVKWQNKREGE